MSTTTPFLTLLKPAGNEFVNETTQLNDNWDKVDTFASGTDARLDALEAVAAPVPILKAVKTADTVRVSTTALADDPHLTVNVLSGKRYEVKVRLLLALEDNATWSGQFVVPGTGKVWLDQRDLRSSNAAYQGPVRRGLSPYFGDNLFTQVYSGSGGAGVYTIFSANFDGYIQTNAAGAFKLQWAQNASDADDTIVLEGSYFRLIELG